MNLESMLWRLLVAWSGGFTADRGFSAHTWWGVAGWLTATVLLGIVLLALLCCDVRADRVHW